MVRGSLRRIDASPADVGRRLTVRYQAAGAGAHRAEAVGVLDRWSGTDRAGILMLRRRDDTTVRIPVGAIEAARVVPPDLSAYRMQELAEQTWPPPEQFDLGMWRLRWAGPRAGRANTVRVAGRPDRGIPDALVAVADWYTERGGWPMLQVPSPSQFDDIFEGHGWAVLRRSRLMAASTQRVALATESARARTDMVLSVADTPDEEWLTLLSGDDVGARADIEPILTAPAQVGFVSCRKSDSGELLGIGRGVVVGDRAGINNMVTAPEARRRGVATAVIGALVDWAEPLQIFRWFLRVPTDSEPALSLYDTLGFTRHHDYVYRAPTTRLDTAADDEPARTA